jgi:5-methylcytosine-specific restriction endonuclease McrA
VKLSTIPIATRKSVMARAWGKCERCGEKADLDLHHLHYRTVGEETTDDLMALCRPCHNEAHRDINGDFWRDPSEMEAHWAYYFREMDRA